MKWLMILVFLLVGCGDDVKKSNTPSNNLNNTTNNATNNSTNNATNNATNNSTNENVDLSQFDQTCTFDQNCVLAPSNVCGCGCDGAINADDYDAYEEAAAAIGCIQPSPVCNQCAEVASCWQGKCQTRTPYNLNPSDYDNSCMTADDCTYVSTGEACGCQCPNAVVNRASYEENPPPTPECTPGFACDCAAPPPIACFNNVCVIGEF